MRRSASLAIFLAASLGMFFRTAVSYASGVNACVPAYFTMPELPASCDPPVTKTQLAIPGTCSDPNNIVPKCTDGLKIKLWCPVVTAQEDDNGDCYWQDDSLTTPSQPIDTTDCRNS